MAYLPKAARPRVPPLPQFTVLVDRDDGIEWVLSHSHEEVDGNSLHVSINDEGLARGSLSPRTDYARLDWFGLGNDTRLFVRGGRLGYEVVAGSAKTAVHTRKGVQREAHELIVPTSWSEFPDMLGWIEESPIP